MEDKIDIKKIAEAANNAPRKPTAYENYQDNLLKYLTSKLENEPLHVVMEIAQYAMTQTMIVVNEEIWKRDKVWEAYVRKLQDPHRQRKKDTK